MVNTAKDGGFYRNLKAEELAPKERKIFYMAITRKFLKAMGIEDDKIEQIIDAHTETVDGLKADIDKYREDALELADVQKELNDLKAAGDGGLQKALDDLQKKYDDGAAAHKTELEQLQGQLAERDYSDAIGKAIAEANEGKGLKFSSKSARAAFEAALREKKLELKDGALTDFDKFVEEQKKADPDAFASDKPAARFAGPVGVGGKPDDTPANVRQAKAMGAAKAEALKASNDVFSKYT